MMDELVAIILPMFNEEKSIPALQEMFSELPLPPGCNYLIIVVNDGSNDNTLLLTTQWSLSDSRVHIISHTENKGLGEAIITGFSEAIKLRSTCIVSMDADATHPGDNIADLVKAILDGADIAIASRFAQGGGQEGVPAFRNILSLGARLFYKLAFPLRGVRDYTINFRAYRSFLVQKAFSGLQSPLLVSKTFSATVELLLKLAPLANNIQEVPITVKYSSKKSPSKMKIMATIQGSLRLLFMPATKFPLGRGLRIQ